jgi:hypothetical protein
VDLDCGEDRRFGIVILETVALPKQNGKAAILAALQTASRPVILLLTGVIGRYCRRGSTGWAQAVGNRERGEKDEAHEAGSDSP